LIVDILNAANLFLIIPLKQRVARYIIANELIEISNVFDFLQLSDVFVVVRLRDYCISYINENLSSFNNSDFEKYFKENDEKSESVAALNEMFEIRQRRANKQKVMGYFWQGE